MRKKLVTRLFAVTVIATMTAGMFVGCGNKETENDTATADAVTQSDEKSEDELTAPYFKKGVYVSYPKDVEDAPQTSFYVFQDDTYGHTEEGTNGLGIPFDCEQKDGQVIFTMGGEGEESKEDFVVKTVESDGTVTGYFVGREDVQLIFKPIADVDPDTFNAQNYCNDGNENIYTDQNGWSVKYNPELFEVTTQNNITTFVYTGESAGTNMVTATYDVDMTAKEKRDKLVKDYGSTATTYEATFPGTEDVDGYWVTCPPAEDGSGLYSTAIVRDFMDGYLMFEVTGHNSGDEMADMEVSDALAMIIDSLTFE